MEPTAQLVTHLLAFGTVLAQVLSILLIGALIFRKRITPPVERFAPYVIGAAFLLTLAGTGLTLLYSDVFGFAPCGLCWLQRCFLYPMPILLGIALWKRDTGVWKYVLGLAIPGALISLYQHYLQMGGTSFVACPASPGTADCAQRIIFEFGYITFPLMAFSLFVLVALLMLVLKPQRNSLSS